jgi:hypothetical protein
MGRPGRDEAAEYYFRYIDRIESEDILGVLDAQLGDTLRFLRAISEERSLHRYEPGKWSIRQVLNHVNDCERVFAGRAFWFARGFDSPLPSFDEKVSASAAGAHVVAWARHVEEFEAIRRGTMSLFRNMPEEGWARAGTASGYPFTVRALAYIIGGHVAHHRGVLEERYL